MEKRTMKGGVNLSLLFSAGLLAFGCAQNQEAPENSEAQSEAVSVQETEASDGEDNLTPEQKLARLQLGEEYRPDHPLVNEFTMVLNQIQPFTMSERLEVADAAARAYSRVQELGFVEDDVLRVTWDVMHCFPKNMVKGMQLDVNFIVDNYLNVREQQADQKQEQEKTSKEEDGSSPD